VFNSEATVLQTFTVSPKGQVVIPSDIRERLGISPGSKVSVMAEGNRVVISLERRRASSEVMAGFGMLKAKTSAKRKSLLDVDVADLMRVASARNGRAKP
jgi:AbrB family looped-hinge helix DNA binding protein